MAETPSTTSTTTSSSPTKPAAKPAEQPAESKLAEGVSYTQPTSQVDLQTRLENDNQPPAVVETVGPDFSDKDGYIGTDPIYYDRANKHDQPSAADEGADKLAEDAFKASFQAPSES